MINRRLGAETAYQNLTSVVHRSLICALEDALIDARFLGLDNKRASSWPHITHMAAARWSASDCEWSELWHRPLRYVFAAGLSATDA